MVHDRPTALGALIRIIGSHSAWARSAGPLALRAGRAISSLGKLPESHFKTTTGEKTKMMDDSIGATVNRPARVFPETRVW
jgi:hypothetical protein